MDQRCAVLHLGPNEGPVQDPASVAGPHRRVELDELEKTSHGIGESLDMRCIVDSIDGHWKTEVLVDRNDWNSRPTQFVFGDSRWMLKDTTFPDIVTHLLLNTPGMCDIQQPPHLVFFLGE